MAFKYLLLDLDNTLYPRESGLLKYIDERIEKYLESKLGLEREKLCQLRHEYWRRYGTTIGGLILHHQINPEEYLYYAYDIQLTDFISKDQKLIETMAAINLPKIVFSNSPDFYVEKVLKILGIDNFIQKIYDIRYFNYVGKPNLSSYRQLIKSLQVTGENCIFVDDFWVNIKAAADEGFATVWITDSPEDNGAQCKINEIYELPAVISKIVESRRTA